MEHKEHKKFSAQRSRGRRNFGQNFHRATEGLPVATSAAFRSAGYEDWEQTATPLKPQALQELEKFRTLDNHLRTNPNDGEAFSKLVERADAFLCILGQAGKETDPNWPSPYPVTRMRALQELGVIIDPQSSPDDVTRAEIEFDRLAQVSGHREEYHWPLPSEQQNRSGRSL